MITDFLAPFPWWQKVMTREPPMSADTVLTAAAWAKCVWNVMTYRASQTRAHSDHTVHCAPVRVGCLYKGTGSWPCQRQVVLLYGKSLHWGQRFITHRARIRVQPACIGCIGGMELAERCSALHYLELLQRPPALHHRCSSSRAHLSQAAP